MQPNITRLTQYLKNLLEIHSPSGAETACALFLKNHFAKYGAEVDSAGNVSVTIPGVGEPVLFSAHMDVVDPSDQISVTTENGYLKNTKPCVLGIDNKSTIACYMEALSCLEKSGTPHRPLEFIFTVAEETTSMGAEKVDLTHLSAKRGLIVDSAKPIGGIITQSPYYSNLDIEIVGPIHHTKDLALDEKTAWSKLVALLGLLPHGVVNASTNINWSTIAGGTGRNTVTPKFSLHGEIRSFSKESHEETIQSIKKIVTDFDADGIDFTDTFINGGYTIAEDDTWLADITRALKKNGVADITLIKDYGVSDANVFHARGLYMINIASGAMFTHTKDETISEKDLLTITGVVIELCTNIH